MEVSDVPRLKDYGDVIPSESYQIVSGRLRGLLELSLTLPHLYPTVNSGVSSEGQGDGGEGVAHDSEAANVSWASNEDQGDFGEGVANDAGQSDDSSSELCTCNAFAIFAQQAVIRLMLDAHTWWIERALHRTRTGAKSLGS